MSLWGHRDFMVLWSGRTLSEVGDAVSMLAIPLLAVTVLNASTLQVSVLAATGMFAYLVISLPAGVIVDRLPKRPLMVICNLLRAAAVGSVAVTSWLGLVTMGQLWTVALISSSCSVFFEMAHQSYLPAVVSPDQLLDANGKLSTTYSVAQVAGLGVGGALVTLLGTARTVALDAASFVVNALSLMLIRRPEPARTAVTERHFRRELVAGLSYVFRHPVLPHIVAATATLNLFSQMAYALSIVFLVRLLHLSSTVVAITLALGMVGGILGGLSAGWLARRVGTSRIIWVSLLGLGWTMLLAPMAQPGWGVVPYALGMTGFSALCSIYNSAQISYRQRICPPELLGRMTASVRWIVWGVMPIGAVLGGALGTWIGVRETLWVAAAGVWASGLWVYFSPLRGMRDLSSNVDTVGAAT